MKFLGAWHYKIICIELFQNFLIWIIVLSTNSKCMPFRQLGWFFILLCQMLAACLQASLSKNCTTNMDTILLSLS